MVVFIMLYSLMILLVFWKLKARVENESGCKIQALRSDNSKEYTSEAFNRLCDDAGIHH